MFFLIDINKIADIECAHFTEWAYFRPGGGKARWANNNNKIRKLFCLSLYNKYVRTIIITNAQGGPLNAGFLLPEEKCQVLTLILKPKAAKNIATLGESY